MENLIGKEKYFVHKGDWNNNYQWRIQKVKVTGLHVDKDNETYAEFSFHRTGYEYPVSYLKDSLKAAKKFALIQIQKEKERQSGEINNFEEKDCIK